MVEDDSDLTIVRSTVDLSHNLGLDVVAEGVENAETLDRLADLGCDRARATTCRLRSPPTRWWRGWPSRATVRTRRRAPRWRGAGGG